MFTGLTVWKDKAIKFVIRWVALMLKKDIQKEEKCYLVFEKCRWF